MSINTRIVLVKAGISKSRLRKWIKKGVLFKLSGNKNNLDLQDTFAKESLEIRVPFLLENDHHALDSISCIFEASLGKNDANLEKLLSTSSHAEVIKDIASKNNLKYRYINWN